MQKKQVNSPRKKSYHKEYEAASGKNLNMGYAHPSEIMQTTSTTFGISLRGR